MTLTAGSAFATSFNVGANIPLLGPSAELEFDLSRRDALGIGAGIGRGLGASPLVLGSLHYKRFFEDSRAGTYAGVRLNTIVIFSSLTGTLGHRWDLGRNFLDLEGGVGAGFFFTTPFTPAVSLNLNYGIRF